MIEEDQFVSYLEVTYGNERINSFYAKLGSGINVLFGSRAIGDSTKGWSFNEEN